MRSFPSISVYQKTRYNYSCTEFGTIPASRAHRYPFVHLLVGGVAPKPLFLAVLRPAAAHLSAERRCFQRTESACNSVTAPAFSVQRHLFVPLDRSESAPRSPERSAIRASHSLRLYTRHNPFFAALSRLHIPFAAFEQSGASSVFAHQKRLCEILSVNIVFRDTTKVRWDRTAGSAVRLLITVLPESGR